MGETNTHARPQTNQYQDREKKRKKNVRLPCFAAMPYLGSGSGGGGSRLGSAQPFGTQQLSHEAHEIGCQPFLQQTEYLSVNHGFFRLRHVAHEGGLYFLFPHHRDRHE